jgi:hypothetical protein
MIFGHDISFWVAVVGATLVKLLTSPYASIGRAVTTVFVAVFAAWAFTDSALHWFGLGGDTYKVPMAALIALTGEGVARIILAGANDPAKLLTLWRQWRGG